MAQAVVLDPDSVAGATTTHALEIVFGNEREPPPAPIASDGRGCPSRAHRLPAAEFSYGDVLS